MRRETGRSKNRHKMWGFFADERCNQAIFNFLATTDIESRLREAPRVRYRSEREEE